MHNDISIFRRPAYGRLAGFGIAVIGASIAGSAIAAIYLTAIMFWPLRFESVLGILTIFLLAVPFSLPVIALAALIFGVPCTLVLKFLKIESGFSYGISGVLLGSLILVLSPRHDWTYQAIEASGCIYGALCGVLWWYFHRRWAHIK